MEGSTRAHARDVRHVEAGDSIGQRVDNFLLREMPGVPRSRVYGMLRKGEARVNGGRIRPDYRLKAGDVVRVPPWHGPIAGAPSKPAPGLLNQLSHRLIYK